MPVWSLLALGTAGLLMFWMMLLLVVRGVLNSVGEDLTEMLDQRP
jgi:hypothetical protein